MTVNHATRKLVRERAKFLCEYCHSSEEASAAQFAIDHILPQSLGGSDNPDNLALACQRCNGYRYNFTTGIDPQTQEVVPLFHPRTQKWLDHFIWSADGLRIIGITPTGRATCHRLDLNDERHNEGSIVKARRLWVRGGWHPPEEDRTIGLIFDYLSRHTSRHLLRSLATKLKTFSRIIVRRRHYYSLA